MKNILENYLYLLTEDPEIDRLDQQVKKIRLKIKMLGAGPEGADALSSKYRDVPENKIPPEHKKKINDFKKAVAEFDEIKKNRSGYSQWVRNGKQGPDPRNFKKAFGSGGFSANSYGYGNTGFNDIFGKRVKQFKGTNIFGFSILSAYIIAMSYQYYKNYLSKESIACKNKYGKKKELCIIQFRINGYKQQLVILQQSLIKANTTNNPKKYKEIINEKIKEVEKKIRKLEVKYIYLNNN